MTGWARRADDGFIRWFLRSQETKSPDPGPAEESVFADSEAQARTTRPWRGSAYAGVALGGLIMAIDTIPQIVQSDHFARVYGFPDGARHITDQLTFAMVVSLVMFVSFAWKWAACIRGSNARAQGKTVLWGLPFILLSPFLLAIFVIPVNWIFLR